MKEKEAGSLERSSGSGVASEGDCARVQLSCFPTQGSPWRERGEADAHLMPLRSVSTEQC